MKKIRLIFSITLSIWLLSLLSVFTYTWVARSWTPSISQNNISISSAGALIISINNDPLSKPLSLNDVVGVTGSFVFKQVSSALGAEFFYVDFSPTLTGGNPVFRSVDNDLSYKSGYIEVEFYLCLDESTQSSKYVYISPESFIENATAILGISQADAIRISLTYINDSSNEVTTILGDNKGSQGNYYKNYNSAANTQANGKDYTDNTAHGQQLVHDFLFYNAGQSDTNVVGNPNFEPDPSKVLFTVSPGGNKQVTMRIWLEGSDENCVNSIASAYFNLHLKFDTVDKPPIITP